MILLDSGRVMVYSDVMSFAEKVTERFRFKLNASYVLLKKLIKINDLSKRIVTSSDSKHVFVLHPERTFVITDRKGQLVFHDFGAEGTSFVSLSPFMSGYLTIDQDKKALKMAKLPIKMMRLSDGYLLR